MSNQHSKIAFFLPNLEAGGAERVTAYLANGLAERGFQVDLVALRAEGPCRELLSGKVRVVDLRARRVLSGIVPLTRYLRQENPAVLLPALDHVNIGALLSQRISATATHVIPTVHISHSKAAALQGGIKGWLLRALIRYLYRSAHAVVAVSQGAADDMVKTAGVPREKVRVIFPILTSGIEELAKQPADHPWFAPGQPPVLLSVGRLAPQKDFVTLIEVFSRLRKDLDIRLMILGEGKERGRLEQLVRSLELVQNVAMPRFTTNVFAYMSRSAVFVLSSAWEGMPMVITEALATGTPVVSTDCQSGPREILAGGRYGRLVPVGDVKSMESAIRQTLAEPHAKVPQEVLRRFAADTVVDQYIQLIQEVIRT